MSGQIPQDVERLLDQTMDKDLLGKFNAGDVTYYIIMQTDKGGEGNSDAVGGEPVYVRQENNVAPEVVDHLPDFGDLADVDLPAEVRSLLEADRDIEQLPDVDEGDVHLLSSEDLNTRFHQKARLCADQRESNPDKLSSRDAAGTNGGRLACAWAVNRVSSLSLKRQIGGGLATAGMVVVLRNKHIPIEHPKAGCVIISPTVNTPNGRNIGHVGIVGEVDSNSVGNTPIYSNSSSRARFEKNFTLSTWNARYRDSKNLEVLLFNLSPKQFPQGEV